MRKIIIILFLVVFSVFYMKAQDTQAITNGFPIEIQNIPYQVSIEIRRDGRVYHCGGSIINNRYVLTAAHCVKGASTSGITIKAGLSLRNNPGSNLQTFSVRNIVRHPSHNSTTNDFDVAVIEIDGTFTFNNFVQPIELISSQTLSAETIGNQARVSGWGWTIPGQRVSSNQLQAVDVPIISNQIADAQLDISDPPHSELTQRMISTGAVGMDRAGACHGDSGGPLVFKQTGKKDIQIGVVSWGVPRCVGGQNSPSIYARLSALVGWIHGKAWSFANIQGSNTVCFNFIQNFTLQNVPDFITTTWRTSSNIQIVSRNNASITVRASSSSSTGNGWVKATLSNGTTLREIFEVGPPNISILPYSLHIGESFTMGTFQRAVWTRVHIVCNTGCSQNTGDMDWNVTATNSSIRHSNPRGLNNVLIKPNSSIIRVSYEAFNECGCSATRFQDFNVVGGESLGGSWNNLPHSKNASILIPVNDGGIIDSGNDSGGQFILNGENK